MQGLDAVELPASVVKNSDGDAEIHATAPDMAVTKTTSDASLELAYVGGPVDGSYPVEFKGKKGNDKLKVVRWWTRVDGAFSADEFAAKTAGARVHGAGFGTEATYKCSYAHKTGDKTSKVEFDAVVVSSVELFCAGHPEFGPNSADSSDVTFDVSVVQKTSGGPEVAVAQGPTAKAAGATATLRLLRQLLRHRCQRSGGQRRLRRAVRPQVPRRQQVQHG